MRLKFLFWLRHRVGVPNGAIAPKWIQFFYYLLFPLNWFYLRQSGIKLDVPSMIYTIEGVKICSGVFKDFADFANDGMKFQMHKVGDSITMRRLQDESEEARRAVKELLNEIP